MRFRILYRPILHASPPTSPSRCCATGPSLSPQEGGEGFVAALLSDNRVDVTMIFKVISFERG